MSELLQEYVSSASQRLRVDRAAGVIRGVKLLGLVSRNGRRYREEALHQAAGLYEGAKVNINHPKGHPLAPRDYQDRLGVVRGVEFRMGEGLFADLHFNPKHALSEQLVWDAEHAPQNVGMSHDVLARTSRQGNDTVVEAITQVQSIDLVADPATTAGLFEHDVSPSDTRHPTPETSCLTLEQLRRERPDLICEIEDGYEEQLRDVQRRLDEMIAREEVSRRRERVLALLQEYGLPLPTSENGSSPLIGPQFIASLMCADDDRAVQRLVEERAALVRSASDWNRNHDAKTRQPRSRHQLELPTANGSRAHTASEFATAIRGG